MGCSLVAPREDEIGKVSKFGVTQPSKSKGPRHEQYSIDLAYSEYLDVRLKFDEAFPFFEQ